MSSQVPFRLEFLVHQLASGCGLEAHAADISAALQSDAAPPASDGRMNTTFLGILRHVFRGGDFLQLHQQIAAYLGEDASAERSPRTFSLYRSVVVYLSRVRPELFSRTSAASVTSSASAARSPARPVPSSVPATSASASARRDVASAMVSTSRMAGPPAAAPPARVPASAAGPASVQTAGSSASTSSLPAAPGRSSGPPRPVALDTALPPTRPASPPGPAWCLLPKPCMPGLDVAPPAWMQPTSPHAYIPAVAQQHAHPGGKLASAAAAPLTGQAFSTQELLIVEDLLFVMLGYDGQYLRCAYPPEDRHPAGTMGFDPLRAVSHFDRAYLSIAPGMDPTIAGLLGRALPLVSSHRALVAFIESQWMPRHSAGSRTAAVAAFSPVERALARALQHILGEYHRLVSQLDQAFRTGRLSSARLEYHHRRLATPTGADGLSSGGLFELTFPEVALPAEVAAASGQSAGLSSLILAVEPISTGFQAVAHALRRVVGAFGVARSPACGHRVCALSDGRRISQFWEWSESCRGDQPLYSLSQHLVRAMSQPYLRAVDTWMAEGRLPEHLVGFCVRMASREEIRRAAPLKSHPDDYWSYRYYLPLVEEPEAGTPVSEHQLRVVTLPRYLHAVDLPPFLAPYAQLVLDAGRYVNILRYCRQASGRSVGGPGHQGFPALGGDMLPFSADPAAYSRHIGAAHGHASAALLDLLRAAPVLPSAMGPAAPLSGIDLHLTNASRLFLGVAGAGGDMLIDSFLDQLEQLQDHWRAEALRGLWLGFQGPGVAGDPRHPAVQRAFDQAVATGRVLLNPGALDAGRDRLDWTSGEWLGSDGSPPSLVRVSYAEHPVLLHLLQVLGEHKAMASQRRGPGPTSTLAGHDGARPGSSAGAGWRRAPEHMLELERQRLISVSLQVPWPFSLVLPQRSRIKLDLIFRWRLALAHAERALARAVLQRALVARRDRRRSRWAAIHPASSSHLPAAQQSHSFLHIRQLDRQIGSLASWMAHVVRCLRAHTAAEILGQLWADFEQYYRSVRTLDELVFRHNAFLDSCLRELMLSDSKLIQITHNLLSIVEVFCDYLERLPASERHDPRTERPAGGGPPPPGTAGPLTEYTRHPGALGSAAPTAATPALTPSRARLALESIESIRKAFDKTMATLVHVLVARAAQDGLRSWKDLAESINFPLLDRGTLEARPVYVSSARS
ncbi:hypothetical protein H696_04030 [Fonticula alba]|uniref:Spindle pole body component n=1 Tax=Fonticula alba TaxID=691883 RepID=A0A058Z667_FONAL|nr:hypothetical protein H696_04030 [Fonticula alba]KCV69611.1 hypothetical protein H696_04030 [Fonticula alba]|eukprot:XP_009496176.1 hypothetical protein H696_04030 [Fonticula alba]